ncbi:hypothetical protein BCV70DRAFT_197085 [Testicularia cyperi]|uniref:MARVEL domain-containing protein n=1 Tax=Testicularia cyperi TaxID=1882483 RepID=A0A317XY38_9BASI|nr:hypothetical protein BCV70DRAFT_197085 [Testicularia cyperi]
MGRRNRGMEFCCCYLPLVNVGAYMLVIETALVSLAVAICALAPPTIVATAGAIPTWSKSLVAALGFVSLGWQLIGLVAVARQMPTLYHTYVRINLLLTLCIIVAAVAFLVVSAAKRSEVVQTCVTTYGVALPTSTTSGVSIASIAGDTDIFSAAGQDICNVFVWVQTGVMAGLIVLMAITQFYMLFAQRAYGKDQRDAFRSTKNYHDIPMNPRDSGVWEPRQDSAYHPSAAYGGAAAKEHRSSGHSDAHADSTPHDNHNLSSPTYDTYAGADQHNVRFDAPNTQQQQHRY